MKKRCLIVVMCVLAIALLAGCKHTHDYGKWKTKKEATCEKEGRKVRECDCGETEEEKIPKLAHKFGEWKVKTAATCAAEGTQEHTCEVCGQVEEGAIPKAEHSYENASGSAGACQTTGTVEQKCVVCDATRTETATAKTYTATELYDLYLNSVGEITTYDKRGQGLSLGSCFVQTADGKLITNYHVIEDAYSAKVSLGGQTYDIQKVLAYDKDIDAAVLQINASGLKPVTICELEHKVGETVYAFGSSKGLTATFSDGMITHAKREDGGVTYVQHSAPISSGNSGGPLINTYGEVIGINTLTLRDSQNLNFAVCITELENLDYSKAMTMQQFYDTESNAYQKMVNYLVANGNKSESSYAVTLDKFYSQDRTSLYVLTALYYPSDGEVWIAFSIDNEDYAYFIVDEDVDGSYSWGYFDDDDYEMRGTLYASSFDSDSLLTYSSNNIKNSSMRTIVQQLASAMLSVACGRLTSGLADCGVTAADLGFVNFP